MNPTNSDCEALRRGDLTVIGRIRSASNATFLCEATLDDLTVHCVYKPVAGEAPLWDFPDGTLAGRELSAHLVSTALGVIFLKERLRPLQWIAMGFGLATVLTLTFAYGNETDGLAPGHLQLLAQPAHHGELIVIGGLDDE